MYYTLNEEGYIDSFVCGGIIEDGIEFTGSIPDESFFDNINSYKVINEELILDEKKLEHNKKIINLQKEQTEIEEWFTEYDKKVAEYNRNIRLGLEPPFDIDKLDEEAITKSNRIKEIRKELEE